MATQKQIEANRRNAQKSTGPRTAERKARASRNRRTHGIYGLPRFPKMDDPVFVHTLWAFTEHRWPQSSTEARHVVEMALGQWLFDLAWRVETQVGDAFFRDSKHPDPAVRIAAMQAMARGTDAVNRLMGRYERLETPAMRAWMIAKGHDPARVDAIFEDDEELDWDEDDGESPSTVEEVRRQNVAHLHFVQKAIRTHFGPGSHRVPPSRSYSGVKTHSPQGTFGKALEDSYQDEGAEAENSDSNPIGTGESGPGMVS
ncbi:MAG TPA: hypothetical protein VF678_00805 [bacterium]